VTERAVVTPAEWRWVFVVGLLVVAVTSVPYLVAGLHQTPDRVFSGCILLAEDCYSYLAKMRQGAEGAWLFHISHTPEEHAGTVLYSLYLSLGKLAMLLPGADLTDRLVTAYHIARVAFGLSLLLTVYRFLSALTKSAVTRRLAWAMVAVGGGLGWLLAALGQIRWLGSTPLDLYFSEGFAFIAVLGFPHVAASQSLLMLGLLCLMRAWRGGVAHGHRNPDPALPTPKRLARDSLAASAKWAALSGLLWLLMGMIAPFYVPVAWAVAGSAWIVLCLRQESGTAFQWREAGFAGLAGLISAPVVVYSAWVFTSDPVYGAWAAQNRILSPHPLHYLAAYGLPLALALFAVKGAWRGKDRAWLALAWVAVVPLLVCLPLNIQLRLSTGVQVPLSLLAGLGAEQLRKAGRRWLVRALLVPMIPTSLFLLGSSAAWMTGRPAPSFRESSEVAALEWLSARSEVGDVVLTAYESGSYLPARVNARVLVGHDLEAKDADQKKELVERFFGEASEDAWRRRFLEQYGVDYVLWGPAERRLGGFDPATAPYLREAYDSGGHTVFEVEP
jgi:hypothetical protein